MVSYLRGLREPYRALSVFALGVVFGLAFDALVDLIAPPHHIRWWHNLILSVVPMAGALLLLRYTYRRKTPNP